MNSINIGVLLPTSTIFPVGKDFEKGLKEALKPLQDEGVEVELVKEFIEQGDIKSTDKACSKFFGFDDVDLITGIVSHQTIINIAERFKSQQTPLVVSELGGHLPNVKELNNYLFFDTAHLWRHAYTLGYYGVKQFGKKGMFISSVYDAGYSFSHMFYEGMKAADPQFDWSFSVPPMPPSGELSDMSVIFPFLEQYQPDFIMATFCGAETTLFLNEFIARGWHHKTKVLGLPYLLAPFAPLNDDITIHTTLLFEDAPDVAPAGAFYHLGLKTGINIAGAIKSAANKAGLRDALSALNTMFNAEDPGIADTGKITIIENAIAKGATTFTSKKLDQWPTITVDPDVIQGFDANIAGWYNPYLCI